MNSITPEAFNRLQTRNNALLIDVRTPAEFREVHVDGAHNVPLDQLSADHVKALEDYDKEKAIYVICHTGNRSIKACDLLQRQGVHQIINVEGGTSGCKAAGVEVVEGKKTISLERQVRIAAGSLVLVGVALAISVHIGFLGLSAFVGAGLVFAGITDTCGMAMLLAKMPWNQR